VNLVNGNINENTQVVANMNVVSCILNGTDEVSVISEVELAEVA